MARYTRETSPWKKRILLPIWIVRDALTVIIVAMYAFILAVLVQDPTDELDEEFDQSAINGAKAVVAVFMTLFIVSLLLDVWCMIQYARHSLSPLTFLIINTLQLLFWIAIVVLQFIGNAAYGRAYVSIFGIAGLLLYVSLFVYAASTYARDRKLRASNSGHYAPAANPANAHNNLSAQEYGQTSYPGPYGGQQPMYNMPAYDTRSAEEDLKPAHNAQYR